MLCVLMPRISYLQLPQFRNLDQLCQCYRERGETEALTAGENTRTNEEKHKCPVRREQTKPI